jgi:hypothetical protein
MIERAGIRPSPAGLWEDRKVRGFRGQADARRNQFFLSKLITQIALSDRHRAAAMIAGHGRHFGMGLPKLGAKVNFYPILPFHCRTAGGRDNRTWRGSDDA